MKFAGGFLLGTATGVALFAQAIVYIWKNDRFLTWAKETDAALNEKFGRRKNVTDLSDLSNEDFQAEVQRMMRTMSSRPNES